MISNFYNYLGKVLITLAKFLALYISFKPPIPKFKHKYDKLGEIKYLSIFKLCSLVRLALNIREFNLGMEFID